MGGRELADAKPGFFQGREGGACSAIDEATKRLLKVITHLQLDDDPVEGATSIEDAESGKR
jgi:hypothetical protein